MPSRYREARAPMRTHQRLRPEILKLKLVAMRPLGGGPATSTYAITPTECERAQGGERPRLDDWSRRASKQRRLSGGS